MTNTLFLRQVTGRQSSFMIPRRIDCSIHPSCSKLVFSSVSFQSEQTQQGLNQEISAAARFMTNSFASSLILASPAGLFVGRVRQLDKMHIRSVCPIIIITVDFCSLRYQVPFGLNNPRRIAHEPSLKAFGVVCTRNEPTRVGDYEPSRSSFQLIDHNSLARWSCSHRSFNLLSDMLLL